MATKWRQNGDKMATKWGQNGKKNGEKNGDKMTKCDKMATK